MHTNTQNKDKNGYGSFTALSEILDVGHYYFMYHYFVITLHTHSHTNRAWVWFSTGKKTLAFFLFKMKKWFLHSIYIVVEVNLRLYTSKIGIE